ncbi:MAG: hypothetical protein JWN82_312 [Candidatus Saccharibacteria bacterium]|nr:hypothetical protein [Candidatus Saccharibacteria bacterium]
MKQKLLHNRHLQICAALIAADCLVFTFVNPQDASALWLIGGFGLLGCTLFGLASLLASSLRGYGERTHQAGKRFLRYGVVISLVLVGLQSIGQLTVKDIAALLPFVVLAYLYFGYGKKFATEKT